VQLLQLLGPESSLCGWLPDGREISEETQHKELMSSIATWLPGAIQSTEDELGNTSNTMTKSRTALLLICSANLIKCLVMPNFPVRV
jgi:hypothetical protein